MKGTFAVTLDVHESDVPSDIDAARAALDALGIVATYFVPTALLTNPRFRGPLRALDDGRSEIGTHAHLHDRAEIAALSSETEGSLEFLKRSVQSYEDFFGQSPRSFRSPCWCWLSRRAVDALAELGYHVDSSSTPQRLGLLSSNPFQSPWLKSPRTPSFVRPRLLEVPTSSFIVPFGRLSLAVFRKPGGLAFAAAFCAEALLTPSVVNIQLHPCDLVADGETTENKRRSWRDFIPRPGAGFGVRHWPLDMDRRRMTERVLAVLALFRRMNLQPVTLSSFYDGLSSFSAHELKGAFAINGE